MTYARSRSRIGARPRITRYARNNADTKALSNPLLQLPLYSGFWGDDPAWTDNPGVGQAVSSWRNGGTLAASGAYLDPTLGLVLPGVAGNYASVPDEAALDITGDITLVARLTPTDWTNAALNVAISKRVDATQRSYMLRTAASGAIEIAWSADGATFLSVTSTATVSFSDGSAGWIAATLDVDNGAGGNTATFWTSTDGATWTQLGSSFVSAGVTSIFSSTSPVLLGTALTGANPFSGSLSVARIYSGSGFTTAGPSGTLVLDVDFRRTSVGAFTCSTGQTVTVASTFNALQATAGSRPTLTTSALLGGRRVVDFDGTDDRLEITTGVSLAQPFEVWWIGVLDTIPSRNIVGLLSTNAVGGMTASAGAAFHIGSGAVGITAGSASSTGTPYLLRGTYNTTASTIHQNGTSIASGTVGNFTVDQIVLGAGRVAPSTYSRFQDGRTAFLGILPAASITATHRRQFALWAASFYSVPGFAAAA